MQSKKVKKLIKEQGKVSDDEAEQLCFDLMWTNIKESNDTKVGFVTIEDLFRYSKNVFRKGWNNALNYERLKNGFSSKTSS